MTETAGEQVRRCLISVADKTGVVTLARSLAELGVEILSTGGTARLLSEAGVPVIEVSDYTGFPEIMDGRVKTLHPRIHGGILGRRGSDDAVMAAQHIPPIDLVVVNLYPFEETVAHSEVTLAQAIEQIDIGGPALLRAAAKNHAHVGVLVDPADYIDIADHLREQGRLEQATRFRLAGKAFAHTARYDGAIAHYLTSFEGETRTDLPEVLTLQFDKAATLRYGENPHQQAAFYREPQPPAGCVPSARQLQGKGLSYNNVADVDAALACVKQFDAPACVIVKHANPCGVAEAGSLLAAYEGAYRTDPTSAFGGIIAFNRTLDGTTAKTLVERQFVEVIIAPEVDAEAQAALAAKPNVRVLATGSWPAEVVPRGWDLHRVQGGLLVQSYDRASIGPAEMKVVSQRVPDERTLVDLLFAWRVAKFVKSNAIVYCQDRQTIGIGAGQMSRVYSARIGAIKSQDEGLDIAGSVLASDAFFPFRDGVDAAAAVGVRAIIQPGGSRRDAEVIAAADEHGIAMVFTGVRHFRH